MVSFIFDDLQYHLSASCGNKVEPARPVANEDIVSQLASMGFNYIQCQKAAINTSNTGVEEAMNWLLSHMDDPGWYADATGSIVYHFLHHEMISISCLTDETSINLCRYQ
jgi:hypothetical protein